MIENESDLSLGDILESAAERVVCILAYSIQYHPNPEVAKVAQQLLNQLENNHHLRSTTITKFLDQASIGHYLVYPFKNTTDLQMAATNTYISKHHLPDNIGKDGPFIEFLVNT